MAFYDGILNLFSSDPATAGIILGIGFLLCHLIHAIRYGFFGFGTSIFDKLKKFFKKLLFLGSFN